MFNTLDEGAEVTLNIDDVYESTHDDFDDLDNNSIKLDAEKQEVLIIFNKSILNLLKKKKIIKKLLFKCFKILYNLNLKT